MCMLDYQKRQTAKDEKDLRACFPSLKLKDSTAHDHHGTLFRFLDVVDRRPERCLLRCLVGWSGLTLSFSRRPNSHAVVVPWQSG